MSTYNGSEYVREQINSILNQKEIDVYLIIRDDGSTDDTLEIIKCFQSSCPNIIRIIKGENVGIHKSFAELMAQNITNTDFVAFSDQDDVWDSDKLITAISQMIKEKSDFYSSASRLVDTKLNYLGGTTANKKLQDHYMNSVSSLLSPGTQGCTIVVTNDFFCFLKAKGIPDYYGHDTWITVVAYYLKKCIYDDIPHMSYRQHNKSWTGNRKDKFRQLRREFHFFIQGMNRYRVLAQDLLNKYELELSDVDRIVISLMSKEKKSFSERLKLITIRHFGKYGLIQNMFFKMFILTGKI
jgi:glycosyltransferase involved in cell wall biosynthesis